jgi:hypothetical protein
VHHHYDGARPSPGDRLLLLHLFLTRLEVPTRRVAETVFLTAPFVTEKQGWPIKVVIEKPHKTQYIALATLVLAYRSASFLAQ